MMFFVKHDHLCGSITVFVYFHLPRVCYFPVLLSRIWLLFEPAELLSPLFYELALCIYSPVLLIVVYLINCVLCVSQQFHPHC